MAVRYFIIGYASLWIVWDQVISLALTRGGRRRLPPLGFRSSLTIMSYAFVPVLALAVVFFATPWVPAHARDMLSLMTPVSLALFAGSQVRRRNCPPAAVTDAAVSGDGRLSKDATQRRNVGRLAGANVLGPWRDSEARTRRR
jgi:hypothetical protein